MFSRPAYPQPRYQRGYSELDALADDLEYRASLARQQARRPASVYESAPQYWNVSASAHAGVGVPHYSRFFPQSPRQPYYEPMAYRGRQPQYYYEPEVHQLPYEYEPDLDYEQRYEYEYPTERRVVRRPSFYAPDDDYTPPTLAPSRRIAHTHYASHLHPRHRCVTQGLDEYAREAEPHCACERDCHPSHRYIAERAVPEKTSVRRRQAEPESEPRPAVTFEDIQSLVASSRQRNAQPDPVRRTVPTAVPQTLDPRDIVGQVLGRLVPEQRNTEQSRHVRNTSRSVVPVSEVETFLRHLMEGNTQAPVEQRAPVPNKPEDPIHSLGHFIGQVADAVAAQLQHSQYREQSPAPRPQHEGAAQPEATVRVRFAPQVQTEPKPRTAPKTASQAQAKVRRSAWRFMPPKTAYSFDPFNQQTTSQNSTAPKMSYTYAAPASAQCAAIPKSAKASASPALPVPGRTFQHVGSNPLDPGVHAKPGAADEVADIMEAIRRSMDRSEDIKPGSAAASAPAAMPASSSSPVKAPVTVPIRASSPVPSTSSASVAVSSIDRIEERFVNLKYDFKFPSSPDFPDPPTLPASSLTAIPELLYTNTNQPIRVYENALTGLLTELDAVDSAGDEEVRHARRELVKRIERELEKLETLRKEAWQRVVSSLVSQQSAEAPKEPVTNLAPVAAANTEAEVVPEPVEEVEAGTEGYVIPPVGGHEVVQTAPKSDAEDGTTKTVPASEDAAPDQDKELNELTAALGVSEDAPAVPTSIDDQVSAAEKPVQTEGSDSHSLRRASEPTASLYPSHPLVLTRPRRSSSPPPKIQDLPASLEPQEETDADSLGSSPEEIPWELASESGDDASMQAQDVQRIEDDVPPSMEESALSEERTEFILV